MLSNLFHLVLQLPWARKMSPGPETSGQLSDIDTSLDY